METKVTLTHESVKRRSQRVIIEYHDNGGPEWWLMHPSGAVEAYDTASAALRAVKQGAARHNPGITITTIEWRDTPEGFTPPST